VRCPPRQVVLADRSAKPGREASGVLDSNRLVGLLGAELPARGVSAHLVHASLSLDERRRAKQAFVEGRDCVIMSTSALELGVDVGDLDRVIQVNSPGTVARFLQCLGRSGRRPAPSGTACSSR
jgi:ATP-dependent Lhr-like helicase